MIVIVDTGLGNLGSLANMFRRIGAKVVVSGDHDKIRRAEKLVLPGVGAFDAGMRKLHELALPALLTDRVLDRGVPCLGVCLGMQLMTRGSEEGVAKGLGWIDATTVRFRPERAEVKVPHMGWNLAVPVADSALFLGAEADARYYFVHSYHVVCEDRADISATTSHGVEFASAIGRDRIMGTQFHPEKSHRFGMRVLENFAGMA